MARSVAGRTPTSRGIRWMPAQRRIISAVGERRGCGYRAILRWRAGVRDERWRWSNERDGCGMKGGWVGGCAIRPEGRHDRAAALCASDGERACAATEAVVERKGGSVEN
eukprot:scaffold3360_cov112-Isochrysis_galbana.AAC.12